MGDGALEDSMLRLLTDPFTNQHMGVTAENLAQKYEVTRQAQDEFAAESQRRALAAIAGGRFKEQILPIMVKVGREEKAFDTDEHPRASTADSLARMKAAFLPDGMVTAGNSSGINDGAAALVAMSATRARELGVQPRLRLAARPQPG